MSEVARKSYRDVLAKIKTVEGEFQTLTRRLDELEGQTASLNAKVIACEDEEKTVYDGYFLGKCTEKDLEAIRKKTRDVKDAVTGHSKMIESLGRCIVGKEKEISALRKRVDSLRHQVWQSLFEAKASTIPETIRQAVRELVTIGLNCAIGRDFILPKIFTMPTNTEIQNIYTKLSSEMGIE